ncbi:MAG: hypothetical protein K2N01_12865 [Lachnospiraceae bacterium]|nr:hypothetical protein [Lachnospiraceae bacterium]
MFFKMSKLKKLLKDAYKVGCLTVGRSATTAGQEEGIYLSSGWWILWFLCDTMEKEIKAAIIELCGDLPAPGEVFLASKGGNQYEIEQKEVYDLPAQFFKNEGECKVTEVILETRWYTASIIQEKSGAIHLVRNRIIEMFDGKGLREGEAWPTGPKIVGEMIGWTNYECYLAVLPIEKDEEYTDFYAALEKITLPE